MTRDLSCDYCYIFVTLDSFIECFDQYKNLFMCINETTSAQINWTNLWLVIFPMDIVTSFLFHWNLSLNAMISIKICLCKSTSASIVSEND